MTTIPKISRLIYDGQLIIRPYKATTVVWFFSVAQLAKNNNNMHNTTDGTARKQGVFTTKMAAEKLYTFLRNCYNLLLLNFLKL
jgi:hypothetical protein